MTRQENRKPRKPGAEQLCHEQADNHAERQRPRGSTRAMSGLALLAPDIVETILDGRPAVGLLLLMKTFPVEWETQRKQLC
jgi:hypothetical protein